MGNIGAYIIGIDLLNQFVSDRTVNYALYELIVPKKKPGYDDILYSVIESKCFNVLFLYSKTDFKVTVRLSKMKK